MDVRPIIKPEKSTPARVFVTQSIIRHKAACRIWPRNSATWPKPAVYGRVARHVPLRQGNQGRGRNRSLVARGSVHPNPKNQAGVTAGSAIRTFALDNLVAAQVRCPTMREQALRLLFPCQLPAVRFKQPEREIRGRVGECLACVLGPEKVCLVPVARCNMPEHTSCKEVQILVCRVGLL